MFDNYSQTYAAAIVTFAGAIVVIAKMFDVSVNQDDITAVLAATVTLAGILWQLYQRYKKGDVTPLGSRK